MLEIFLIIHLAKQISRDSIFIWMAHNQTLLMMSILYPLKSKLSIELFIKLLRYRGIIPLHIRN
ncbi:hypothetical protein D4M61_23830 [Klebsiella pneumoniae]|nr:hypothetical protein D4M61_23830 [Klebsiella pneumoniae]